MLSSHPAHAGSPILGCQDHGQTDVQYTKTAFKIQNPLLLFSGNFLISKYVFIGLGDHPLIVQFAAKEAQILCDAARIICPFADGIDLNCGCPQR